MPSWRRLADSDALMTQMWFVAKVRFYEIPLLLSVTVALMRPDAVAIWTGVPHDQRYWVYSIGLAIFGLIYLIQKLRIPKPGVVSAN